MPPTNHYRDRLQASMVNMWGVRTPNNLLAGSYLEHDGPRYWWVYSPNGDEIAKWECRPFPGCATLVVTTHIELREDLRGQGLGKYFHELRRKAYKAAGFQGEVCTVREDSDAQQRIVARDGNHRMGTFNSDFGGRYVVWLLPLTNAQVPQVPVPSPQVDLCGSQQWNGNLLCNRPPGHYMDHQNGAATWPNMQPQTFEPLPLVVNGPVPRTRKPKTFSHRKGVNP